MPPAPASSVYCRRSFRAATIVVLYVTLITSIFTLMMTLTGSHKPSHENPLPEFTFILPIFAFLNMVVSSFSLVEVCELNETVRLPKAIPWLQYFIVMQISNFLIGLYFIFEIMHRNGLIKFCEYTFDVMYSTLMTLEESKKLHQRLMNAYPWVVLVFCVITVAVMAIFVCFAVIMHKYQKKLTNRARPSSNDADAGDIIALEAVPIRRTGDLPLILPYYGATRR